MNTFHLFLDFFYFSTITTDVPMLQALVNFQRGSGDYQPHTFTVLNPAGQWAISQTYERVEWNTCRHGQAFKHQMGVQNPTAPSYDELVKRMPKCGIMYHCYASEHPKGRVPDTRFGGDSWVSYMLFPGCVPDEAIQRVVPEAHGTGCEHDCSGRSFLRSACIRRTPWHVLVTQSGGIDI